MSGNILQEIVASYVGALIQREHIKNKRLDDIVTTAGNDQQQKLERVTDRLKSTYGTVATDEPSEEYGKSPRQLGVTPYPAPPNTTSVVVKGGEEEEQTTTESSDYTEQTKYRPPEKAKQEAKKDKEPDKPSKQMSPLKTAVLTAALTAGPLAAGWAADRYWNRDTPEPVVEQAVAGEAKDGSVDILVR